MGWVAKATVWPIYVVVLNEMLDWDELVQDRVWRRAFLKLGGTAVIARTA